MDRNIIKYADAGRKRIRNDRESISATELLKISEIAKQGGQDGLYDAIITAFYFGFMVAYKQKD